MDQGPARRRRRLRPSPPSIYLAAFVTGAIVMSFEMLGSRYLNPYFGSGIYTWASLISTVLAALCVGYFIGGVAADRYPSRRRARRDRADRLGLHPGAAAVLRSALMEFVLAGVRRREDRQPRRRLRDPVLSGDVPRHVFAVRHPAAAALGAELGPRLRHGLRHLDRRQHRRHARHDVLSHSGDRHARDHARRSELAGIASGLAADRAAETARAPRGARARGARPAARSRPRAPTTWSTRRSAPTCSSAPTAASRTSRPNTTTSSSPSGATSSPCRSRSRATTTPSRSRTWPIRTTCRCATRR